VTFSKAIFLGLGLGIVTGLFFGDLVAFLNVVADGYIKLLQMTVLPYVMVSLITGLGSLTYRQAKMLFFKVGGVMLVLWTMSLALVFLMPLAFPRWETASFFSTALLRQPESVDFLQLYIPANPFHSMASNIVPAVVLFSVIIGVALIGVKNKERFIEVLDLFNQAITRATGFVVKLTPIGIFAIAANTAGTMTVEEFGRLQVYLILYVAIALLITFWVLPALVTSFTPIRYREVVGLTKDALASFAAGRHRPRFFQLPAHGKGAHVELCLVCGLVLGGGGLGGRLPETGHDGTGKLVRQSQCERTVLARCFQDTRRHVRIVPGHIGDQRASRHAGGRDAHGRRRGVGHLRDPRCTQGQRQGSVQLRGHPVGGGDSGYRWVATRVHAYTR
jgi:hypothetical protein